MWQRYSLIISSSSIDSSTHAVEAEGRLGELGGNLRTAQKTLACVKTETSPRQTGNCRAQH